MPRCTNFLPAVQNGNKIACVAVVSVSFKPSGVSARGHWAKRSKKVGAGGRGGKGKEMPAAEPRHFTKHR